MAIRNRADRVPGPALFFFATVFVGAWFLIVFTGADKIGGVWTSLLVLTLAVPLALTSILWSWRKSLRFRLASLAITYICITSIFAAIHYAVFVRDPTSYAFASSITSRQAHKEFASTYASFLSLDNKLFALALLYRKPEVGLALMDQWQSGHEPTLTLSTEPVQATIRIEVLVAQVPGGAVMHRSLVISYGQEVHWIPLDGVLDEEADAAGRLVGCKTVDDFRSTLRTLITVLQQKETALLSSLSQRLAGRPEWDMLDFFYFSNVTITTVGFGDIIPNRKAVRMIITCETFTGVLFIAFALSFLWPQPKQ